VETRRRVSNDTEELAPLLAGLWAVKEEAAATKGVWSNDGGISRRHTYANSPLARFP